MDHWRLTLHIRWKMTVAYIATLARKNKRIKLGDIYFSSSSSVSDIKINDYCSW
jgi:hypothetical protein